MSPHAPMSRPFELRRGRFPRASLLATHAGSLFLPQFFCLLKKATSGQAMAEASADVFGILHVQMIEVVDLAGSLVSRWLRLVLG